MKRPMVRLQIAGLRRELDPILDVLQQLACIEIGADGQGLPPVPPAARQVQEEELLGLIQARIDGLLDLLQARKGEADGTSAPPISSDLKIIQEEVERIGEKVRVLAQRRDALEAEQASLPRYKATLRRLVPLMPEEAGQPDYLSEVVLVSDAHRWVLRNLEEQVNELAGGRQRIVEQSIGDGLRAMFIVVPRDMGGELQTLLGQKDIAQMQLPETLAGRSPDEAAVALEQRLAEIPAEISQVERDLEGIAQQWVPRLRRWRRYVARRLERIAVRERIAVTEHAFVLTGWTPVADEARVRRALDRFDTIHILSVPPHPQEEDVPVALDNPAPARPFETLVRLMVYPRYDGIDPTILMAIFLPIFFGMILGDVGYAAVIFLLCLGGLRRFREPGTVRDIVKVLLLGSVWAAVFGVLYGEAFGTLGEEWGLHALWLERAAPEYVTTLLLFTIGVGVVHVALGLILGVWVSWQERNRSHLLERGGMLVGLTGLLLLVGALTDYVPGVLTAPSVAVLVVGLVLLGSSQGWLGILLGPIEFIGLLGNILSYLRIAAVGLASVYVALVANEMAGNLGSLLVGIIVAVLIHALNIVLGAFSPTIHSLRLHYVEFFRKFYEGGGRPFQPFGGRG